MSVSGPNPTWRDRASLDPADVVIDVVGDDATLARAARDAPGTVLRFAATPASDFARALGLGSEPPVATVVACDLLDLDVTQDGSLEAGDRTQPVANAVVLGVAPDGLGRRQRRHRIEVEVDGRRLSVDRATTVVVANGQFLRGMDLVPRGHPGDGRCEVQVYALTPGERPPMRRRLGGGTHLPHPRIAEARGREVHVRWLDGPRPVEADGQALAPAAEVHIRLLLGAGRVLI